MTETTEPPRRRSPWAVRSGLGLLTAVLLLALVEGALHQDAVIANYAAVFGAGRAMEKLRYLESAPPELLLLGNSRMDNGFDPRQIAPALGLASQRVFNLGIPGANMMVLQGVLARLDAAGMLGPDAISKVVLELDENEFINDDSLNLGVFLADRGALFEERDFAQLFAGWLRLWGYSANIKGLREPGTLQKFLLASVGDLPPWGGPARDNLGYRPGVRAKFQTVEQLRRQQASISVPPSDAQVRYLWRALDLLAARRVQVAVVYPPLLDRKVSFLPGVGEPDSAHRQIAQAIDARGIPQLAISADGPERVEDFANAGHLNAEGGRRYSQMLGRELFALWGGPGASSVR